MVNKFCETIEKAGYFVGIYSGKYWFRDNMDMSVLNRYTIWLAQWTSKPDYEGDFGLWQYTDSGNVNGISGNVDMNIMYVDFPTIIKQYGLNGFTLTDIPEKEPVVEPEKEEIKTETLKGDINGDGVVDLNDVIALIEIIKNK